LACFAYVAYSDKGFLEPLVLQAASALRAVAFEHTHPAQAYTLATRPGRFRRGAGWPSSSRSRTNDKSGTCWTGL
jgi:hypothetical protein